MSGECLSVSSISLSPPDHRQSNGFEFRSSDRPTTDNLTRFHNHNGRGGGGMNIARYRVQSITMAKVLWASNCQVPVTHWAAANQPAKQITFNKSSSTTVRRECRGSCPLQIEGRGIVFLSSHSERPKGERSFGGRPLYAKVS